KRRETADRPYAGEVVIDYGRIDPEQWLPDGVAFGRRPVRVGKLRLAGAKADWQTPQFVEHGAAEFDPVWHRLTTAPGVENEPGATGSPFVRAGKTLRTPRFE